MPDELKPVLRRQMEVYAGYMEYVDFNVGRLLATKNIFFVPFGQDDPVKKINSLVARNELIIPTLEHALEKKQIQPMIVEKWRDLQQH